MNSIDSTYRQLIRDNLNSRLENAINLYDQIPNGTIEEKKWNLKLYYEISFFTEYIFQNELTRQIFTQLLRYEDLVKNVDVYSKNIKRIADILVSITNELSKRDDLKSFTSTCGEWKNPYYGKDNQPITIELTDWLTRIPSEFDRLKNFKIVKETFATLTRILECWHEKLNVEFEDNLLELVDEYFRLLKELEYYSEFRSSFLNVTSAINIYTIFQALNPRYLSKDLVDEMIILSAIRDGEYYVSNSELIFDCRKILNHINSELNGTNSLELVVSRFKSYIELYSVQEINSEKDGQMEFERFIFLNGYYPISEARLGDGRLDSLATNENNAFLYEYKFVRDISDLKNQIASANIQADSYQGRLAGFPQLANDIFIIIFTQKKFEIKGQSMTLLNGINFHVVVISLDRRNPSKIKNMPLLGMEEIITGA